MFILYAKAFHVIGMVAWFAAIFFLGRIYIYHKEAIENKEQSIIQLCEGAEKRLINIILIPSAIITTTFGIALVYYINALSQGWFHMKFLFVLIFFAYNYYLVKMRKTFISNKNVPTSKTLRLLNEVPFILLILIVLLVYLKSTLSILIVIAILISFILFYLLYVNLQKKNIKKNKCI